MKTTLATIKKFIRDNKDNLYINYRSSFDGMIDGTRYNEEPEWVKVTPNLDDINSNDLGIKGAWIVKSSRDYFRPINDGDFQGYSVYNCCGSFYLGTKA